MPTPDELIAQALNKRTAVSSAAQVKRDNLSAQDNYNIAAGAASQNGLATANPTEVNLRTLNPSQMRGVYGDAVAEQLSAEQARGDRGYLMDATGPRTFEGAAADAVSSVGMGLVNSIGGIGALGAGTVSEDAGAYAADALKKFNDWGQSTQSESLQGRRRAMAARNAMNQRDNTAQFEKDKETDGNLVAGLKRIGRDAMGALRTGVQDPAVLSDGIAQGVGSLLGGLPLGRAAGALGVGERAAMPLAIGAMEGGGAYAQSNQEVMAMPFAELEKNSPTYRELRANGLSPEEARTRIANRTGLTAAAIQAPIGAATGTLVSKFEGAPLATKNLRTSLANIGRETLEEGLQSASGQTAQNFATQQFANENQSLTEDVGEQTALGALYGAGTAGAVQAPKLAGQLAVQSAKTSWQGVKLAAGASSAKIAARADAVRKRNEEASPISAAAVSAATEEVAAVAPQDNAAVKEAINVSEASQEQKAEVSAFVDKLTSSIAYDENDMGVFGEIAPDLVGSKNRTEAIVRTAQMIPAAINAQDTNRMLAAAGTLVHLTQPLRELVMADPEGLSSLDAEAKATIAKYTSVLGSIEKSPTMQLAIKAFKEAVSQNQAVPDVPEAATTIEPATLTAAITVGTLAPEHNNLKTVNTILQMSQTGDLYLEPHQYNALIESKTILEAERLNKEMLDKAGIKSETLRVRDEIFTKNDPLSKNQKSAAQHVHDVISAVNAGDSVKAAAWLEDLGKFVQHLNNKVEAANEHFALGNSAPKVKYQALSADNRRAFGESPVGMYVNRFSPTSIALNQEVDRNAALLADIYNGLAKAYPDLGQGEFVPTRLNSALTEGTPADLARKYQLELKASKAAAKPTPAPAPVAAPTPVAPVVVAPEPVQESQSDLEVGQRELETEQRLEQEADARETAALGERQLAEEKALEAAQAAVVPEPAQVTPPVVEAPAAPVEVPEATPATPENALMSLFPNLVSHVDNFFMKAFKAPSEPKTRIIGSGNPISLVRDALSSSPNFQAFTGTESKHLLTPEAIKEYQDMLTREARNIAKTMNDSLAKFLSTKVKGNWSNERPAHRWVNGKALNITEQSGDTYKYNPELQQAAILAGFQWWIDAPNKATILDDDAIEALTGIDPMVIKPEDIAAINQGLSTQEVIRGVSEKVASYWGVTKDKSVAKAYTDGIPMAVAAEVTRALIEHGYLEKVTVEMTPENYPELDKPKTIDRYLIINRDNLVLTSFPNAIEEAVMIEPEQVRFFGDDVLPVAKTQMNNAAVKLTPAQVKAIEEEQKTPFYVNPPMINFFASLGEDNLLRMFDAEVTPSMNAEHEKSVIGQARTHLSGFHGIFETFREMQNRAESAGIDVTELPTRFRYNMSRVGRMQMLGKYSPQASKLAREAFLPTQSTLDMSSEQHRYAMTLAMGQAFGIKVHTLSREQNNAKLAEMLVKLQPAIEVFSDWFGSSDMSDPATAQRSISSQDVDLIKSTFKNAGADMSVVALHALVEHVRLERTPVEEQKAFKTSLYLEADGVTNGPINAMMLMTTGKFTNDWLTHVAKGGVFFGQTKTMAEHRATDNVDLYESSTIAGKAAMVNMVGNINQQKNAKFVIKQMNKLHYFMGTLSKDVIYDPTKSIDKGGLELKRGIAKNPLTITLYGSGAVGIANKVAGQLVDTLYERMSAALTAMTNDSTLTKAEALFPGSSTPEADYANLLDVLNDLTNKEAFTTKKGIFVFDNPQFKFTDIDLKAFKLNRGQLANLQTNMKVLFVDPMRQGIDKTVGEELMDTVDVLRMGTQVQSILYADAYKRAVDDALKIKENDPTWRKGDYLSQQDLDEIVQFMLRRFPAIRTADQQFLISKSAAVSSDTTAYGRALDDSFDVGADVYMPTDAKVAGIPFLTIGMGDGMMMQTLALKGLQGTLKIFDGMNMPLDKIEQYSRDSNEAVYNSVMGNPLKAAQEAYAKSLEYFQMEDITKELYKQLSDFRIGLDIPSELSFEEGKELLYSAIQFVNTQMQNRANSIDQRHEAMQAVAMSVDHMASASAPYANNNQVFAAQPSNQEILDALNNVTKPKAEPVKQNTPVIGAMHPTGVQVITKTALQKLARGHGEITDAQQLMLSEIVRSGAAQDIKIVTGSMEQLESYLLNLGQTVPEAISATTKGWFNPSTQTAYLVNPTSEVLVHELIHATTFNTVLDYFESKPVNAEAKEAIERIGDMLGEFLDMDISSLAQEQKVAYKNARTAVQQATLVDGALGKASAMNEFMAWALTNEQITKDLATKQAPKIVQFTKMAVKFIKQIIWGKAKSFKVGEDFLSNLQFNTAIIVRTQNPLSSRLQDIALQANAVYGSSDRLQKVRQVFADKIGAYLNQPGIAKVDAEIAMNKTIPKVANLVATAQASGFPMSAQEKATFESIAQALSTEIQVDSNALAQAQELFSHVTKNLDVEAFMADPASQNPADRYYAQQKYDFVIGKSIQRQDVLGRSSLLPVFLALATVNDDFREVLNKIAVPKSLVNKEKTMDATLENVGNKMMDKLSERLSGQNNAKNVREAIDNLQVHIERMAATDSSTFAQLSNKSGSLIDDANDYVVNKLEQLSDAGIKLGTKLEASTNKATRAAGSTVSLLAKMATEERGEEVAMGVMEMMNKSNVFRPIRDFVGDLVGRTKNNADVYDMIKQTRSAVSQLRQQFRESVPRIINGKFKREVTKAQWKAMFKVVAKTDLAAIGTNALNLIGDQAARDAEILRLESAINPTPIMTAKMKQLANYMNTGEVGNNLLRNAYAVSRMWGEGSPAITDAAKVKQIDELISLYALDGLPQADRVAISSLVQTEPEGMNFVLSYLIGQRKEESSKASSGMALNNSYKGYIPSDQQEGVSLVIADDSSFADLAEQSYVRVGAYKGSDLDQTKSSQGYYFAPVSGRAIYNQGIMQNVRHTAGGVDQATGYTMGMTAGRIADPYVVATLARRLKREGTTNEPLLPVYDDTGAVVAFERAVDPQQLERLNPSMNLAQQIGIWRGRQVEERRAQEVNEELVNHLYTMYREDIRASSSNQKQYINLFDYAELKKDPVLADAVKLFNRDTLQAIETAFGKDTFMIRKDMLNDAIGYRSATVGDVWTGNSRWSKDTQTAVKNLAIAFGGNSAYKALLNSERVVQNFMSDARTTIVVKSVVVPMANFMSNILQLISQGVPVRNITKSMPAKLAEIDTYTKSKMRQIEIEAELRATTNPLTERKLRTEIKSLTDAHKRMSIWPLIEAGEFSTIADVGMTAEDVELTSGSLGSYIEKQVDKLPNNLKTAARYGLVSRDTALFQGLQKSVQYGDFLAKAVMYDDMLTRQKMSKEQALGKITEAFVNYDRLSGRTRGYLENIGLLWFYNFKIRSAKWGLYMLRNNPVHALIGMAMPVPNGVGTPIGDNIVAKALDGSLSWGAGQALAAPALNPWWNLAH